MATSVLPPTDLALPGLAVEDYLDLNNTSTSTIPQENVDVIDLPGTEDPPVIIPGQETDQPISIPVTPATDPVDLIPSAEHLLLDNLLDVTAPSPADGDIVVFDEVTNTWIAQAPAAVSVSSLVDVSTVGLVNGASLVYNSTTGIWSPVVISGSHSITKLDDIPDVAAAAPNDNDVLSFDSASQTWIPVPQNAGGGGGATTLDGLTDVSAATPSDNDVLSYDSASQTWIPAAPPAAGATTLDGLTDVVAPTPSNNDSLVFDQIAGTWVSKQQFYTSAISDGVMSSALGGASSMDAAVWKTKSIAQALDTILFPDILPTYTIPTITLSGTVTGTREIGSALGQSLTSVATENDAGIYTAIAYRKNGTSVQVTASPTGVNTTDVAAQFGYADPNNPNKTYSTGYTENGQIASGTTSWTVEGAYNAGLAKQNNKGVMDIRAALVRSTSAPQAASTVTSSTVSVSGIYPFFWGKSSTQPTAGTIAAAIAAGTATKVLTDASGTITVTFNALSEYVWVAHLGSYTSKTKWYNTALNNGNIGAGNFILSPVSQNVSSPNGYWSSISFKIYISSGATDTSGAIEFRNS